jgi:hypothetical protein
MEIRSFFAGSRRVRQLVPRRGVAPLLTFALLAAGCTADPTGEEQPPTDRTGPIDRLVEGSPEDGDEDTGEAADAVSTSLWSSDYCHDRGWRVGKHDRILADVDGDGLFDVVGFNDTAVLVGRSTGTAFAAPVAWSSDFVHKTGFRTSQHLRFVADISGDRLGDVVAFLGDGVYVARSMGDRFGPPARWLDAFGDRHGWRSDRHLRRVVDINRDGLADIVAIGEAGIYHSLAVPDAGFLTGAFLAPVLSGAYFTRASGWQPKRHPIDLADFDGDGLLDIGAFLDDGVYVSRFDGAQFLAPVKWSFHFSKALGRWAPDKHLRYFADVNGDGRADAVGFHDIGVYAALSTGVEFGVPKMWTASFGPRTGGWRTDRHIRRLADINGDLRADVVGFGDEGVWVSLAGDGRFADPVLMVSDFGVDQGWTVRNDLRLLGNVAGTAALSIVGFNKKGVYVSPFFDL